MVDEKQDETAEEPVKILTEEEISRSYGNRAYNADLLEGFILETA